MSKKLDTITVFDPTSELAVNDGSTGVVEKVIIGENATVQYQLICYKPERYQVVVGSFEVSPIEGKCPRRVIGFAQPLETEVPKMNILLDESGKFVTVETDTEVEVKVLELNAEELEQLKELGEVLDGEETEKKSEDDDSEEQRVGDHSKGSSCNCETCHCSQEQKADTEG